MNENFLVYTDGFAGKSYGEAPDRHMAFDASILDADLIARENVEPSETAFAELGRIFKENILIKNRLLNRVVLREITFSSCENKDHTFSSSLPTDLRKTLRRSLSVEHLYYNRHVLFVTCKSNFSSFFDRSFLTDAKKQNKLEL